MGIEIVQEGPVVVVAPDGDLSRESRREVKQTLEGFFDKSAARIVVDLSRVAYIDSTIWGELAAAGRRAPVVRDAGTRALDLYRDPAEQGLGRVSNA